MVGYSDINEEIIDLWKEFPAECGNRIPLLFPPGPDGGILYISFNPSFPRELEERNWSHSYNISGLDTIDTDQVISQEIETQGFLAYFKPLRDIATELELPWSHLDIFMIRDTSQERTKPRVLNTANQLTRFGKKQFQLFTKALKKSTPKAIVVINALASEVIRTHLPLAYNSLNGCYYAQDSRTPFLLAGMLTGQRALDIFSRERLIWHIHKTLMSHNDRELRE